SLPARAPPRSTLLPYTTLFRSDEEGDPLQFTWRTIQTWYSRYKKDGITTMKPKPRSDRGKARKVEPELVQEAIDQVLPHFRGPTNLASIYRCLHREELAATRQCRSQHLSSHRGSLRHAQGSE